MRQTPERYTDAADRTVKDIRRKTRKRYSSEEKVGVEFDKYENCGRRDNHRPDKASKSGGCHGISSLSLPLTHSPCVMCNALQSQ